MVIGREVNLAPSDSLRRNCLVMVKRHLIAVVARDNNNALVHQRKDGAIQLPCQPEKRYRLLDPSIQLFELGPKQRDTDRVAERRVGCRRPFHVFVQHPF